MREQDSDDPRPAPRERAITIPRDAPNGLTIELGIAVSVAWMATPGTPDATVTEH